MPLSEGQVSIRGLVMGTGTPYRIMSEFNPFNRTARANQSGERAWNHGRWSGVEWLDEAVVPMRIFVEADDVAGWLALHQQLMAAFAPVGESGTDVELRFAMGGREYMMRGRPRMVEPDLNLIGTGKSFTQAAFVALDPLIYSGAESVAGPLTLPTYTGGLVIPAPPPMNPNPSVEVDTAGWGSFGGTLTRSTLVAHDGAASAEFVPDGVSTLPFVQIAAGSAPAVTAGRTYRASAWVYAPGGYSSVFCSIRWRDSTGAELTPSDGAQIQVPAGVWTRVGVIAAAPSGAATGRPRVTMTGTPASGNVIYVDEMMLADPSQGGVTVPFTIGAVRVGGTVSVVNEGTAETGMFLRIDGPVDQPVVSLQRADATTQTLRFDLSVAAGQWLEVDTAARTVLLNGETSMRGRVSGDWLTLPPGSHTLRWQATSGTGTLTVRWRSAWW